MATDGVNGDEGVRRWARDCLNPDTIGQGDGEERVGGWETEVTPTKIEPEVLGLVRGRVEGHVLADGGGGGVAGVACSAFPRLPHTAVEVQGGRTVTREKPGR